MKWFTFNRQGNLSFSITWLMNEEWCVLCMPSSRGMLCRPHHLLASISVALGQLAYISLHPSLQMLQITVFVIYIIFISQLT